ncbi:MAG: prolipoprotein diacylglyceryl transferase family protein [Thermodesulfobacteriota bacterium]
MVPYFEPIKFHLFGPVYIHVFGLLVAAAVVTGWSISLARCRRASLDSDACRDLMTWAIVVGFVSAHLYSVIAYFPQEAARNPLLLLKLWENISSFGGIAGGVLGIWLWFRFRGGGVGTTDRIRYLDAVAYGFTFAWIFGRLGCTVAHDHPGVVTSFPLAVSLETPEAQAFIASVYRAAGRLAELPPAAELAKLGYHDLGWYEFLYTLTVMAPAFLWLGRKERRPGYLSVAFLLLYTPVRFFLDFLRLADATYYGLTPAQYAAVAAFVAALGAARRLTR